MLPATLDDLKVLDLSQGLAGPICAKILADFGADVVKVEPLAGDAARGMAPFFGNESHPEKSLVYLLANLNKRGVKINFDDVEGCDLLRQMALKADIIIESYKPGYLASLGLDYETLSRGNPGLIKRRAEIFESWLIFAKSDRYRVLQGQLGLRFGFGLGLIRGFDRVTIGF